jgi:hypothetical protein
MAMPLREMPIVEDLPGAHVNAEMRRTASLSDAERARMFALLDAYYLNAQRDQFERDLAEKQWVMTLTRQRSRELCGFSTLMRFDCVAQGEPIVVLYSGDTVLENDLWGGSSNLAITIVLRQMMAVAETCGAPAYWFLISSTYKSYRLLPHLFRTFAPRPGVALSDKTVALLDALVQRKFKKSFDPAGVTVSFSNPTMPRESTASPPAELLDDPFVRFFLEKNPRSDEGERLVSIAELTRFNLTKLGLRLLGNAT